MDAVFLKLFNMSVAAGWLILAVLVLRVLLRKAPRWIHCLMWGIVALRLICPVSLQSVLSLIPSTETVSLETIRYEKVPEIRSGIPAVNEAVNPVLEAAFTPDVSDSANPLAIWMCLAGIAWLFGAVVFLALAAASYVCLRRQVREAACLSENVWECDAVHTPFILGVLRPRIYLPSGMDEASAGYVLAHERSHLARRDHWWKLAGYILLAVYWFHPLVWAAYILFCRDVELACDERVVRSYNMDEKKAYSGALLSLGTHRRKVIVCPLAFGEVGVKERVKSVLNYKKPALWLCALAVAACAVVAVCFLTNPEDEEIYYHGYWLDAGSFSDETVEWLRAYNRMSSEEQLAVQGIPDEVLDQLEILAEKKPEEDAFRERLERATEETVREFFCEDLNGDGKNEAVAVTSETVDGMGYYSANMWYISDSACELFDTSDDAGVYADSVRLYEMKGTRMLCCVAGWGGSGRYAMAWVFDGEGAKEVENVMEGITQLWNDEFIVTCSGWGAAADGSGHNWNPYFSHWDGEKLVEYGGLEISEEQLRKAEHASEILDAVRTYGDIQSIYYRANGMVFINLSNGASNRNVALYLANGELSYYDYENPYRGPGDETTLENATGDGFIYESCTTCVAYPEKFPLDEVNGRVMLSYMLDAPQEMPAVLYEGGGFLIYLPDNDDIIIYDKTLEEPARLSAVLDSRTSIEVMCYEGKSLSDVEGQLQSEGYAYDGVYDTGGKKMQKLEEQIISEARLHTSGENVWVVCTRFNGSYDLGSQMDAVADTFRITEN